MSAVRKPSSVNNRRSAFVRSGTRSLQMDARGCRTMETTSGGGTSDDGSMQSPYRPTVRTIFAHQ